MTTSYHSSGSPRRIGQGLLWSHIAATLLTAAEFVLLQAIAIGLTTVVYLMAPMLDAGAAIGFADWLKVFQIVSPTITVTAGAPIVISSYIYAKKAQEAYDFAAQAMARAEQDRERAAQDRERAEQDRERAAQAEAEVARLTARLAQLENGGATPEHPQ